jgi:hypothetical protein
LPWQCHTRMIAYLPDGERRLVRASGAAGGVLAGAGRQKIGHAVSGPGLAANAVSASLSKPGAKEGRR